MALALLATFRTRADLLRTNSYSFDGIILRFYSGNVFFTDAIKNIGSDLAIAQTKTEALYQAAITSTLSEIKGAFDKAKPLSESDQQVNSLCTDFIKFKKNKRLRTVSQKCNQLMKTMR